MKSKIISKVNIISTHAWINIFKVILFTLLFYFPISSYAAKVTDFIPKESVAYLQINDLDEVYNEIKMSETWEKELEPLIGEEEKKEIKNGLMLVQNIIGTDVYTVIETVGYQIGFAMWLNETGNPQSGIVVHSGGNLAELKRLTKIATGLLGMSEGTLTLDAGEHRKVKYDTLQMPDFLLVYGFVGDFLVVGIQENSFEKLIDTYRKKSDAIKRNESYVETTKSMETGQVNMYVDIRSVLPYLVEQEDLDEESQEQVEDITVVSAVLNLLEEGPILQLQAKFDLEKAESTLSRFLKEGEELLSLKSLSGDEDLFITVAPGLTETVWELIYDEFENSETDDAYALITFLEGLLNLNFDEDVVAGLTGEFALSIDNLSLFEPSSIENLNLELFESFHIDAGNVHTNGGIIFNSANSGKWEQIKNSLSNIQNTSVSKTDYKDTDISIFGTNIYYAEKGGLSLLSFSDDQMFSMIDGIEQKKKLSYMKTVPKKPLAFAKLNLLKILELVSEGNITINEDGMTKEFSPLLAWIDVQENSAMFEVTVSEKESPLEVLLKFVPYVVPYLN